MDLQRRTGRQFERQGSTPACMPPEGNRGAAGATTHARAGVDHQSSHAVHTHNSPTSPDGQGRSLAHELQHSARSQPTAALQFAGWPCHGEDGGTQKAKKGSPGQRASYGSGARHAPARPLGARPSFTPPPPPPRTFPRTITNPTSQPQASPNHRHRHEHQGRHLYMYAHTPHATRHAHDRGWPHPRPPGPRVRRLGPTAAT